MKPGLILLVVLVGFTCRGSHGDGSKTDSAVVPPSDGGTAGASGGSAGSDGGSETGTAGGGTDAATDAAEVAGGQCLPDCLTALMKDCPLSHACTSSTDSANQVTVSCYDDGVKTRAVTYPGGKVEIGYKKADGNACIVRTITNSGVEYATPEGTTLARIFLTLANQETIACGGSTYTINPLSPACQQAAQTPSCTAGACTW